MEDIYSYITKEKVSYAKPIDLEDGWSWGMKDHLRRSFLYKNSQFEEQNENRTLRPNKNIITAILNVQYRTEGFDVKDIDIFVNDAEEYYKSTLVRKFHEKWALENSIDTFIDEVVESYCDYGGALVRKTDKAKPEVIDLRSLAFCNQTNILAYPFCIRHVFSPSQLRDMTKWGENAYGATMSKEDLITLVSKEDKKEIEIFEVHGNLPIEWLEDNTQNSTESKKDVQQIQIVAFYQDQNKQAKGVTLFQYKEPELPFKFLERDQIIGRALGRGAIEELFEAQKWTNWNEIKATEMLEAASKVIGVTDDPQFASKHPSGLKDVDNMEILEISEGRVIKILDNYPRNLILFENSITRWQEHAMQLGSANELTGESPNSGTPFKLYEANLIEAKGMHKYRQGKIAVFMDEIYRDWILPKIQKEIAKDNTFLSEFSVDELQSISDTVVDREADNFIKKQVLSGIEIDKSEIEQTKQVVREQFLKGGTKRFIEILKEDIKKPLSVMTNIAGKQKNLALLTDKLVNVLRQYISTPQIRQDPSMAKLLNTILESSGLSPIMFGSLPPTQMAQPVQPQAGGSTQPMQQLAQPA